MKNNIELEKNELYRSFQNILPYMQYIFDKNFSMGFVDSTGKILRYIKDESLPINVNEGDVLPEESADMRCQKKGETIVQVSSAEVFGVAGYSVAIPIKNENGQVIGSVGLYKSVENQAKVTEISNELLEMVDQMAITVNQISANVQGVVSNNEKILKNIDETRAETENTDEVIKFIENISKQTNLLGLNAAIESARAGEYGKGFSVVAQEIRKLSNSSSESINQVSGVLNNIMKSVVDIDKKINSNSQNLQEQAAAIEQINASIQQLSSTAQILKDYADKL